MKLLKTSEHVTHSTDNERYRATAVTDFYKSMARSGERKLEKLAFKTKTRVEHKMQNVNALCSKRLCEARTIGVKLAIVKADKSFFCCFWAVKN